MEQYNSTSHRNFHTLELYIYIYISKSLINLVNIYSYKKTKPKKFKQALRATKKLLVVRHPFERLLSAYRDKLENSVAGREHGTLHFYQKYGSKIVEKYRGESRKPIDRNVFIAQTLG